MEDEFIYVLQGELTLITDAGEERSRPEWPPAFPPTSPTGIISSIGHGTGNATSRSARDRSEEEVIYSDIDMMLERRDGEIRFFTKAGEPY